MHARLSRMLLVLAAAVMLPAGTVFAADKKERDIFDYAAQKAASDVKKIVFVADTDAHGARGNHEFLAAAIYLARTINANYPGAYCVVYTKAKWPKDLKHADTVIVLLNHGGSAVNEAVKEATGRGAGFMAIHYGVEVNKGEQGDSYLKWLGGYFEPFWSVNPWWTPEFKDLPHHEVTRGVKPFTINDEWYYHMRFVGDMKGVTPILAAVAPTKTISGLEGRTEARLALRQSGRVEGSVRGQGPGDGLGLRAARQGARLRLHRPAQAHQPRRRQLPHAPAERRRLGVETGCARERRALEDPHARRPGGTHRRGTPGGEEARDLG